MEHTYTGGGSWTIPNMQTQSNTGTPSNQDHLYLPQQQFQQPQFQLPQQQHQPFHSPQNQQFQSPQNQQLQSPQNQMLQSPPQNQQFQSPPQQQQYHSPQQQQQQRLFHLVEKLAEAVENGTRDQQTDALISDLSSHFEKFQQLLNSISASIGSKAVTVEGQKRKLEETEQLLNQRRDLITKYKNSVEDLVRSEP